jgi:catechol 2,3-dioxygenase-like lactoylglutathione lyase family enzyme
MNKAASPVSRKEAAMASLGLSHVELTVRDLERSLHFYRDLLGLRVLQEGTEQDLPSNQSYEGIFERPNRKFRFVVLQESPELPGPGGMRPGAPILALIAPQDPLPTGTSIKADQVGITHIGLWVDNLDAVYAELTSKGVPFVVPPHMLLQTPTGGVRSAFSLDPDGILVQLDELVEGNT